MVSFIPEYSMLDNIHALFRWWVIFIVLNFRNEWKLISVRNWFCFRVFICQYVVQWIITRNNSFL